MYRTTGACADGELDKERTEATCCSRNRYGIGYRLWRRVFQYLCWRGTFGVQLFADASVTLHDALGRIYH